MTRHSCCVKAKKLQDPQGFATLSPLVLIASHNHAGFMWGSPGFTLENYAEVYYVMSMGIKVMTQHVCPCTWCFRTSSGSYPNYVPNEPNEIMWNNFLPKPPTLYLVSSPDPTLEEGKGSGDFGQKAWSSWQSAQEFTRANQIAALAQSYDSLTAGM